MKFLNTYLVLISFAASVSRVTPLWNSPPPCLLQNLPRSRRANPRQAHSRHTHCCPQQITHPPSSLYLHLSQKYSPPASNPSPSHQHTRTTLSSCPSDFINPCQVLVLVNAVSPGDTCTIMSIAALHSMYLCITYWLLIPSSLVGTSPFVPTRLSTSG